ncbi:cytochrome b/b6 domain-containing protein [Breoghania sp. L-A4]|uniref:cytochrome b n=1 Tax=Breoghania sp. L-A4 TaxID=2304600 RepID=UPI003204E085
MEHPHGAVWHAHHAASADPRRAGLQGGGRGVFREAHELLAWGLIALLGLHIAAAFKHHLIARDDTVRRMTSPRYARGA